MIKSMTGFGKASGVINDKQVKIEIKSLNSNKGLDLSVKTPSEFRAVEYHLRNKLSTLFQRGKIDVFVYVEALESASGSTLNKPLITAYFKELKAMSDELRVSADHLLPAILRMPDVAGSSSVEVSEEEKKEIEKVLDEAFAELDVFRIKEGAELEKDLRQRVALITDYSLQVKDNDKRRVDEIRNRLKTNLESVLPNDRIDNNRYEQEIIYYLEKLDITEELIRLKTHCEYFLQTMDNADDTKGRKLGFIAQEIGREINTIGSKANDAVLQKIVVNMKDELEKIKEQINNVV